MNLIKKIRYKNILEIQGKHNELASAVLYYLQCGDRKQRIFVERILDKYTYILNKSDSIALYNIPDMISFKLLSSYKEALSNAYQRQYRKEDAEIAEMDEIF